MRGDEEEKSSLPEIKKDSPSLSFPDQKKNLQEMPFKDSSISPSEDGWTPQRSAAFGADYLGAILDALPALRAKREAEDAGGK